VASRYARRLATQGWTFDDTFPCNSTQQRKHTYQQGIIVIMRIAKFEIWSSKHAVLYHSLREQCVNLSLGYITRHDFSSILSIQSINRRV
jgi:hypothetical protein